MQYDHDKVDEMTMALLYLVTWERREQHGFKKAEELFWKHFGRKSAPDDSLAAACRAHKGAFKKVLDRVPKRKPLSGDEL